LETPMAEPLDSPWATHSVHLSAWLLEAQSVAKSARLTAMRLARVTETLTASQLVALSDSPSAQ